MQKWRDLLKRHRVQLDKETNIQAVSTEPESRKNTNKDLINRLLPISDPLIIKFLENVHIQIICISFLSLSQILIQMLHCRTWKRGLRTKRTWAANVRTLPANVRTWSVNCDFCSKSSFKCRTMGGWNFSRGWNHVLSTVHYVHVHDEKD